MKLAGTVPDVSDRLMICEIGNIKVSMQAFNKHVGMGSRSQDFVGEDRIIRFTSASDAGMNATKGEMMCGFSSFSDDG